MAKLEADLNAAHQSQDSANSAVSKQRLNSDIEMQKEGFCSFLLVTRVRVKILIEHIETKNSL